MKWCDALRTYLLERLDKWFCWIVVVILSIFFLSGWYLVNAIASEFSAAWLKIVFIVTFIWSLFQGWTGYQYGLYICKAAKYFPRQHIRKWAYGFHHGAFYFVCSFAGFISASFLGFLIDKHKVVCWNGVAGGTGAIIVALSILAVLGISGILPRILYLGQKPV